MKMKFLFGSRVYGFTTKFSDYDYLFVDMSLEANVSTYEGEDEVWSFSYFQNKLDEHDLKAIEIYFDNKVYLDKLGLIFTLDKEKLRRSVSSVVSNSYVKAKKKFQYEDVANTYLGLKSYWHCVRILIMFSDLAYYNTLDPRGYSEHGFLRYAHSKIFSHIGMASVDRKWLDVYLKQDLNSLKSNFRLACPLSSE